MKRSFYTMLSAVVLMLLFFGCNKTQDVTNDEEAIKYVINAETQAWIDKNPEKMKEFYIQDKYQTRLNIQDSVYSLTSGWDKRATAIDTLAKYADWVGVDQFQVKKDFLIIKVMDNTAWAILKETQNMIYNGSPATAVSIINIVLEKQNKDWKISCFVKSSI
jgi:hypothetical protein